MRISHYAIIRDVPSLMMLSLLLLLVEEAIAVLRHITIGVEGGRGI
jgi:hypothetical protein